MTPKITRISPPFRGTRGGPTGGSIVASMPDGASLRPPGSVGTAAIPSRLSRRLEDGRHPDTVRAFRIARHAFLDGERIDMGELAARLEVDRTTLFRWVGNRDQLLAEVMWSIAAPTFDRAAELSRRLSDGERVVEILGRFIEALNQAEFFRVLLRREPARALRLLTTGDSPIAARYRSVLAALLAREYGSSTVHGMAVDELAYLLVRITEAYVYADLITGEQPSSRRARAAVRLLLRVD
jgi:AcrR family transcriptional regulator